MGHKPTEAVTRNAVVDVTCVEEPALILIRHCQDMKKQETRLRFITLLLLLGCGALALYISCAVLWSHGKSVPAGAELTLAVPGPTNSRQQGFNPNQIPDRENFHIYLQSLPFNCTNDTHILEWEQHCSPRYGKQRIRIPRTGTYFIYTRVVLSCLVCAANTFSQFAMKVDNLNNNYETSHDMAVVQDSLDCRNEAFKNVYMGQLFVMSEGDHITITIMSGMQLIKTAFFGAHPIP